MKEKERDRPLTFDLPAISCLYFFNLAFKSWILCSCCARSLLHVMNEGLKASGKQHSALNIERTSALKSGRLWPRTLRVKTDSAKLCVLLQSKAGPRCVDLHFIAVQLLFMLTSKHGMALCDHEAPRPDGGPLSALHGRLQTRLH